MRKAFQWTYQQLDSGRSRASLMRASKRVESLRPAIKEAFQLFDRLKRFDLGFQSEGKSVIGIDEVGRGPLAGPIVAVAVQLPYPTDALLPFLRDSKKLLGPERECLAVLLKGVAVQLAYGVVEAEEFGGDINLHHLTFLAMSRALQQLHIEAETSHVLIDGKFRLPQWSGEQTSVIKGDDASLSIAAASVLAKVYRDRRMRALHRQYPHYGFDRHVGYGTEAHRHAILQHGACPEHRKNFLTRILQ